LRGIVLLFFGGLPCPDRKSHFLRAEGTIQKFSCSRLTRLPGFPQVLSPSGPWTGKEIIIILCGGDKTTRQADIARARDIAKRPLEEQEE
jgi:hypothetical protein